MFRMEVVLSTLDGAVEGILPGNFVIDFRKSIALEGRHELQIAVDLRVDGLHLAVLDSVFLLVVRLEVLLFLQRVFELVLLHGTLVRFSISIFLFIN